jgi:hypothetical protein
VSANLFVPIDPAKYLDDPSGYADFLNGYDYSGESEMTIDLSSPGVEKAIKNAIRQAKYIYEGKVIESISEGLAALTQEE